MAGLLVLAALYLAFWIATTGGPGRWDATLDPVPPQAVADAYVAALQSGDLTRAWSYWRPASGALGASRQSNQDTVAQRLKDRGPIEAIRSDGVQTVMRWFAIWDPRPAQSWAYFVAEYELTYPEGVLVENVWLERTLADSTPAIRAHLWTGYPDP